MLKVKGNKIYLTRGDTMITEIKLKDENGNEYTPKETDKVYFRLKKSSTAKDILIEKEVLPSQDTGELILQLDEADTDMFKFGTYFYEIELVTEDDYHFTAIENEEFVIGIELENHG